MSSAENTAGNGCSAREDATGGSSGGRPSIPVAKDGCMEYKPEPQFS